MSHQGTSDLELIVRRDYSYTSNINKTNKMVNQPNSSSPSSFSSTAAPQLATSSIRAADALAAVNLLPSPKAQISNPRLNGIMSASNNITALSHSQAVRPPSDVALLPYEKPEQPAHALDSTKSYSTPILIVEHLNPQYEDVFGLPQMTTNSINMASENATSNNNQMKDLSDSARTTTTIMKGQVRMKIRPKKRVKVESSSDEERGHNCSSVSNSNLSSNGSGVKKGHGIWHQGRFDVRGSNPATPFSWDVYLSRLPSRVAPREAFRQPKEYPKNLFEMHMKLEARDPRNANNWCLASVVHVEGVQIGIRLEGTDKMNDLFELIDSENIRPIGSKPGEPLLPPTGFVKDIASYTKFVEKILKKATYAVAECFPPPPPRPPTNLFEPGMKLEAVDRKHRDMVCPATIAKVTGNEVRVSFDGWSDSFDYTCEYYSRDLFPVNYCRDVGRSIQQPGGWPEIVKQQQAPPTSYFIGGSTSPDGSLFDSGSSMSSRKPTASNPGSAKKRTPSSSSPKTTPLKKGRGRTKKNTPTKSPKQGTQSANSTPEKKDFNQEIIESNITISDETVMESSIVNNDDDLQIEGYQCQRSSIYPWEKMRADKGKRKIEPNQMPQTSSSDSIELQGSVDSNPDTSSGLDTIAKEEGIKEPENEQPSVWTIQDVIDLISKYETFKQYSSLFREHEIDGKAFMLLTHEVLIKHMGVKVGHAVKIIDLVNQVKKQFNLD